MNKRRDIDEEYKGLFCVWWHFSDVKEYSVLNKDLGRKSYED